jgi:isopentenyl diphosphate isomerase/L-lactate dehydrogenase-like FMN-dependent dehydrogenase
MLAPIGSLQAITEGGVGVARAAEEFGTINFVSSVTQPSLDEIAAASRNLKVFQLCVQGDFLKAIALSATAVTIGPATV